MTILDLHKMQDSELGVDINFVEHQFPILLVHGAASKYWVATV